MILEHLKQNIIECAGYGLIAVIVLYDGSVLDWWQHCGAGLMTMVVLANDFCVQLIEGFVLYREQGLCWIDSRVCVWLISGLCLIIREFLINWWHCLCLINVIPSLWLIAALLHWIYGSTGAWWWQHLLDQWWQCSWINVSLCRLSLFFPLLKLISNLMTINKCSNKIETNQNLFLVIAMNETS